MIRLLVAVLTLIFLNGCSLGFYAQATGGQLSVLADQIPIDDMLNNPDEHPELVERLRVAVQIRNFAVNELGLPDSGSFKSYVHLDRPYAVWNVVATPEFSLEAKIWCYLVVGCLTYRGYFDEHVAERYAQKMRRKGYDVAINGVLAYSTLGWFDDPLFSTIIRLPDSAVAELIFHELAHELVFVQDDADFNEAFATTVGEVGVYYWLKSCCSPDDTIEYQASLGRQSDFIALLARTHHMLSTVYASASDANTMRHDKQQAFTELKAGYWELKKSWDNFDGFDWWFERDLNNAHIAAVDTYRRLGPVFTALLAQNDFDLRKFYDAVRQLAQLEKEERDREIRKLLAISAEPQ